MNTGLQRTITARRMLTDVGSVEYPVLTIGDDGTLADISSDPKALADETEVLTAAFFDIHNHGALGYDVMTASPQEFAEMHRFLAQHGVAQYLPSTVTDDVDRTLRAVERIADAIERIPGEGEARPLGIHLEGPFISHVKRGMHPTEFLQPPSIALFDRLWEASRGHVRLMTVAPEADACAPQPGFEPCTPVELIRHATAKGVRCSIGHSNAVASDALTAIEAGAASATHTFNAMRPLDHREPGILGTVLTDDRLYAELICDGVHVAPPLVRLWFRAKTAERGILITDALMATGMPPGDYSLGSTPVRIADGRALVTADLEMGKETLAGSVITLADAVRNVREFTGATLAEATRMAADNPAKMLGMPERTRLAPGGPANLNRWDASGRLVGTYLRGKLV